MDNTRMQIKEYKHCRVLQHPEKRKTIKMWKGYMKNQIKQKRKYNEILVCSR